MTAREKDEMAAHLSDNVDGIICKPFDPIELPIQISAILRVTGAGAV
jgi:DNA-binding response OmpR family regulator